MKLFKGNTLHHSVGSKLTYINKSENCLCVGFSAQLQILKTWNLNAETVPSSGELGAFYFILCDNVKLILGLEWKKVTLSFII